MHQLAFLMSLGFPALLATAAVGDVLRYRIPNAIPIALALLYLPAAVAAGAGFEQIAWHLGAGLIVLLIGMALFFANLFGGADAKLLAACACWTGFALMPPFLIVMALAGGVLALVLILLPLVLRARRAAPEGQAADTWLARQLAQPRAVPYGVAIAVGGIAVFHRLPTVLGAIRMP